MKINSFTKLAVTFAFTFAALPLAAPAQPQLVSSNPSLGAAAGDGDSLNPVMSRDGRYVLFASAANNISTNTNGGSFSFTVPANLNVYLYDRTNNTMSLVSVSSDGSSGGDGDSLPVTISSNGQFVLFESTADNLVAGDTNNANDIFVRDVVNNVTTLVSIATNGVAGSGASRSSTMTLDGRYVAFVSAATNLVVGDTNGIEDVFVRDLQGGSTVLASVGAKNSSASVPAASSEAPDISDNGQYVAFFSTATNLVAGITNTAQIYVRDLVNNVTLLASTNAASIAQSTFNTNTIACSSHILSADGQYVAFIINAKIVVPAFPSGVLVRYHVFTGSADIVNTNAQGAVASYQNYSRNIDMSSDGNFITFVTNSYAVTNTALPDALWVWNAQANTTTLVAGDPTNTARSIPDFYWPQISDDGRYISFLSSITNLTTNSISTNTGFHVYLGDTLLNTITMVDARLDSSAAAYAPPSPPSISSNGLAVAFDSFDPNLATGDTNADYDVFLRNFNAATPGLPPIVLTFTPPATISWAAVAGHTYQAQFKNNVTDANWQPANGTVTIVGNQGSITDLSPSPTQKFYRVVGF